jgi:hypothetical protein
MYIMLIQPGIPVIVKSCIRVAEPGFTGCVGISSFDERY